MIGQCPDLNLNLEFQTNTLSSAAKRRWGDLFVECQSWRALKSVAAVYVRR
jgi:hypothetical protein